MVFMLSSLAGRLFFNAKYARVSARGEEHENLISNLVLGSWFYVLCSLFFALGSWLVAPGSWLFVLCSLFLALGSYTATCCNIATTSSVRISTS